ncbi:hypothetical protein R1sor_015404 [Riccia sorocarpa]|uniref:Rhodanese domain-containing protein n=1 Tax=Riccia sorocarpa TaxID=122646 RepID=A0ABD3HFG1_9MARC
MEDERGGGGLIGELDLGSSSSQENSRLGVGDDDDDIIEESPKSGRLRIANVGGSLTVLLQIALVAWGVRQLRSVLAKRRQRAEAAQKATELPYRAVDPPEFSMLSPTAVKKMVELDPVPHILIDVRFPSAVRDAPSPFETAINIPEGELKAALQLSEAEWEERFPSNKKPGRSDILVFLSTKGRRAQRAANAAADLGFSGCCVLNGGLEAYEQAVKSSEDQPLKFLSRDAVSVLLHKVEKGGEVSEAAAPSVYLVDVRRHDERALYGHIKGSHHVPVEELPKALSMDSGAWEKTYRFPKFSTEDTVVFQCRTSRRATWAAQLAHDFGMGRCFVYKDGVYGWRFDPSVLPYDSYEIGDAPPKPIDFHVEKMDPEAGKSELQRLGLL